MVELILGVSAAVVVIAMTIADIKWRDNLAELKPKPPGKE